MDVSSTTRQSCVKYYEQCNNCEDRISGKGKCGAGYDNFYYRSSKNNGCPKISGKGQ